MKKWLTFGLAALTLSLAACSDAEEGKSEVEQNEEEMAPQQIEEKPVLLGEKTEEVKAFLTELYPTDLDVLSPDSYATIVFNVIVFSDVPSTLNEENYTSMYKRSDLEAAIEEQFGVKLDLTQGTFAHPSEQMSSVLTYADDTFYMAATDFYRADIKREFDEVVEVKENVYYVEMTDHEFEGMGYGDYEFDFQSTPIDQMPADAEPYLTRDIKRFAVVKIVDGEPKLQYIGLEPLAEAQIEKY